MNYYKIPEELSIKEFNLNISGLNDGRNYPKDYIFDLVEDIKRKPIIRISNDKELLDLKLELIKISNFYTIVKQVKKNNITKTYCLVILSKNI